MSGACRLHVYDPLTLFAQLFLNSLGKRRASFSVSQRDTWCRAEFRMASANLTTGHSKRRLAPLSALVALCIVVIGLGGAISGAGRLLGHTIAMGGHTDDETVHEIVIGNNVIAAPSNAVRFEKDRRSGTAERLDLYLSWPTLEGFTKETSGEFNNLSRNGSIVFVSFEPRMMSRDMSGRFEPIYKSLIEQPGTAGPGDTTLYSFKANSGYVNEELAVASRAGQAPFVARCLTGGQAEQSLAECQRDVVISDDLIVNYRFPMAMLGNWQALDAAISERARFMVRTGTGSGRQ